MEEKLTFVEQVIKRTCRKPAYEFENVKKSSNQSRYDRYSREFLKSVYDDPVENLKNIINGDKPKQELIKILNDCSAKEKEHELLIEFLFYVKKNESFEFKQWSELRHFMYYVYRNFISATPNTRSDSIPNDFIAEMRRIVSNLMGVDISQLIFRIYGLLREFCILARKTFCKMCDKGRISITKMFYFYEALIDAARSINDMFEDIINILQRNYSFSWIDLNTCIFIHYFIETGYIKSKIFNLNSKNFSPSDTPTIIGLFSDLKNIWYKELDRVGRINGQAILDDTDPRKLLANRESHQRILLTDFWIDRANEEKRSISRNKLDHHVFNIIGDTNIQYIKSIYDESGHCLCEQCLITKYATMFDPKPNVDFTTSRPISCHRCNTFVPVNLFATHILDHVEERKRFEIQRNLNEHVSKSETISKNINMNNTNAINNNSNNYNIPNVNSFNDTTILQNNMKNFDDNCDEISHALFNLNLIPNEHDEPFEKKDDFENIPDDLSQCSTYVDKPDFEEMELFFTDDIDDVVDFEAVRKAYKELHPDVVQDDDQLHFEHVEMNLTDLEQEQLDLETEKALKNLDEEVFPTLSTDEMAELERTRVAFTKFLKKRSVTEKQSITKSVRNFLKIKKDIFNPSGSFGGQIYDNVNPLINQPKNSEIKRGSPVKPPISERVIHKPQPVKTAKCDVSCNKIDDLKTDVKKPRPTCEHHKEKKCDCKYCGVFGTNAPNHGHKSNELRDRLRIRLHQRREKRSKDNKTSTATSQLNNSANVNVETTMKKQTAKIDERVPPTTQTEPPAVAPVVLKVQEKPKINHKDIRGILNYIEGNKSTDKIALAEKKAAKKARQRIKKEEERLKIEEEKRKAAEAKKLEEEKRKAAEKMAKELAEKMAKDNKRKEKKKNNKAKVIEETIPALVTIKRVYDKGTFAPSVTVTLKGSHPDQEKLFYTLVKSEEGKIANNTKMKTQTQNEKSENQKNANKKKKNKTEEIQSTNNQANTNNSHIIAKDVKVTLAVDPNATTNSNSKKNKKNNDINKKAKSEEIRKESKVDDGISLPIRLPPGITITKVEGPVSNRNLKSANLQDQSQGSTINVNKSGVIVVDTEKLIQQTNGTKNSPSTSGKKNKKNKKKSPTTPSRVITTKEGKQMITLRNPAFQTIQSIKTKVNEINRQIDNSQCAPAAIFTSANGMVTIRSSRLQHQLQNGHPSTMTPLSELKSLSGPDIPSTTYSSSSSSSSTESKRMSAFNAQEILSGLPGIEITKVDKNTNKMEADNTKNAQTAQVSIIPTSNNDKFNLDRDDWPYDSVFVPKEIEDDMDPEERELEAFKRFCQQSVPPERKEKVAHLNVKDIFLKRKTDSK